MTTTTIALTPVFAVALSTSRPLIAIQNQGYRVQLARSGDELGPKREYSSTVAGRGGHARLPASSEVRSSQLDQGRPDGWSARAGDADLMGTGA